MRSRINSIISINSIIISIFSIVGIIISDLVDHQQEIDDEHVDKYGTRTSQVLYNPPQTPHHFVSQAGKTWKRGSSYNFETFIVANKVIVDMFPNIRAHLKGYVAFKKKVFFLEWLYI